MVTKRIILAILLLIVLSCPMIVVGEEHLAKVSSSRELSANIKCEKGDMIQMKLRYFPRLTVGGVRLGIRSKTLNFHYEMITTYNDPVIEDSLSIDTAGTYKIYVRSILPTYQDFKYEITLIKANGERRDIVLT